MNIKELSWQCTRNTADNGSLDLIRTRYDIYITNKGEDGSGNYLEGLDIDDLKILHSLLQEIFAYDDRNCKFVTATPSAPI